MPLLLDPQLGNDDEDVYAEEEFREQDDHLWHLWQ